MVFNFAKHDINCNLSGMYGGIFVSYVHIEIPCYCRPLMVVLMSY